MTKYKKRKKQKTQGRPKLHKNTNFGKNEKKQLKCVTSREKKKEKKGKKKRSKNNE